jgi:hypothetical protein
MGIRSLVLIYAPTPLAGNTVREATSDEVKDLRSENRELKEVVAWAGLPRR